MVYKLYMSHWPNHTTSTWIWKTRCMSKHKVFAWLLLHDRLNTKEMMLRRHWNVTDSNECVLCTTTTMEDWKHLFFNCNFSIRIWSYLQIQWRPGDLAQVITQNKKEFNGPCFMEIVILACWAIWKQRNSQIFKEENPTFRGWKRLFLGELTLLMHRVKADVRQKNSS